MRGLMRNKRKIFYSNFMQTEFVEDANHKKTGRKKVVYRDVKPVYATVSIPTGKAVLEMFGTDKDYDIVVTIDKSDIDVTENSVFWINVPYGENVAHDHIVTKILRPRNYLFIALRSVNVKKATEQTGDGNGTDSQTTT